MVAVEAGVMRSLTAEEETEFQCILYLPCTDSLKIQNIPAQPASLALRDTPHGNPLSQGKEETLLEFVLRLLRVYGVGKDNENIPD